MRSVCDREQSPHRAISRSRRWASRATVCEAGATESRSCRAFPGSLLSQTKRGTQGSNLESPVLETDDHGLHETGALALRGLERLSQLRLGRGGGLAHEHWNGDDGDDRRGEPTGGAWNRHVCARLSADSLWAQVWGRLSGDGPVRGGMSGGSPRPPRRVSATPAVRCSGDANRAPRAATHPVLVPAVDSGRIMGLALRRWIRTGGPRNRAARCRFVALRAACAACSRRGEEFVPCRASSFFGTESG